MNKCYALEAENRESVSEEDLGLINSFSHTPLSAQEVFCFKVLLCDNEIDRDFERFTTESLKALADMFVGKTAIKNHSMNSDDQSARTYKTEVVTDPVRKNSLGEPYSFLTAYCYMPRLEKNAELIEEIKAGIKKEVSVGCSVSASRCSICGKDRLHEGCVHRKGKSYGGRLCFDSLENPTDAYEWSFVAVPAQKNAGVTKSFKHGEVFGVDSVVKELKEADGEVLLSSERAKALTREIDRLTLLAKQGEEYRGVLSENTVKLFALTLPSLSSDVTRRICSAASTEDLKELEKALGEKRSLQIKPQTAPHSEEKQTSLNEFRF